MRKLPFLSIHLALRSAAYKGFFQGLEKFKRGFQESSRTLGHEGELSRGAPRSPYRDTQGSSPGAPQGVHRDTQGSSPEAGKLSPNHRGGKEAVGVVRVWVKAALHEH